MCPTFRPFALLALLSVGTTAARAEDPWVVFEGKDGPGRGKNVVLIAADDEYRSEELIPQLAKILAFRHGFRCTVLFAIDPNDGTINPGQKDNIPGLEKLDQADLLVLFARFRELPDEQMKHLIDYVESSRPIVALRTSTHAFNYSRKDSPYAKYTWTSNDPKGGFGRLVLGETWVNHHGHHNVESTRGLPAEGMEDHPILRGVTEIWGPSDVYAITTLSGDSRPLVMGQVLKGMKPTDEPNPNKSLMPIAWIKSYEGNPAGRPASSSRRWATPATSPTKASAACWSTPATGRSAWRTRSPPAEQRRPRRRLPTQPDRRRQPQEGIKPSDLARPEG